MQFKDGALERATLGLTAVALAWWVLATAQAVGALLPGAAAVLQVLRLCGCPRCCSNVRKSRQTRC